MRRVYCKCYTEGEVQGGYRPPESRLVDTRSPPPTPAPPPPPGLQISPLGGPDPPPSTSMQPLGGCAPPPQHFNPGPGGLRPPPQNLDLAPGGSRPPPQNPRCDLLGPPPWDQSAELLRHNNDIFIITRSQRRLFIDSQIRRRSICLILYYLICTSTSHSQTSTRITSSRESEL